MKHSLLVTVGFLGALLAFASAPAVAQGTGPGVRAQVEDGVVVRRRPRIEVRPRARVRYPYRRYNSVYPVPYDFEYPGPGGKRDCVDRYVVENRPSGTVVVPRMSCRWVPG